MYGWVRMGYGDGALITNDVRLVYAKFNPAADAAKYRISSNGKYL